MVNLHEGGNALQDHRGWEPRPMPILATDGEQHEAAPKNDRFGVGVIKTFIVGAQCVHEV